MNFDIEALRTFLTVHRAGGFARAAEALRRSQPAISRRVAQLEADLGAPLFDRSAAEGGRLSQAGRFLLPHAERALAAFEDCRSAMSDLIEGRAGAVDLAVVGTLAGAGLTAALKTFVDAHPHAALALRTATSRQVSALVRSGEAGLGLRYHHDPSGELCCEPIARERLCVACRPDHPLLARRDLLLLDLAGEPWLAFPDAAGGEPSAGILFAEFLRRGAPEIRWTAIDSLTAQKRMIEAGLGLALLPESALLEERRADALRVLEVADLDASNPVHLVTRRGGYLSPVAAALTAALRDADLFADPA